jgi:hypothetical protein
VTDFRAVGTLERIDWNLGMISLEAEYTRGCSEEGEESAQPRVAWPSWAAWAAVYASCREDYLAWFGERFPGREPGAERLYRAWLAGGEAALRRERDTLAEERAAADPRRLLGVF